MSNSTTKMGRPITTVECVCQRCGTSFKVRAYRVKNGTVKYCSKDCQNKSLQNQIECKCENCGKTFLVKASQNARFCSRECFKQFDGKTTECKCEVCGKKFRIWDADLKRGHGKFCSTTCTGIAKRNGIECICEWCGKTFTTKPAYLKVGKSKYCSNECYGYAQQKNISCVCEYCGKEFFTKPSRIKEGGGKHCSKACYFASKRNDNPTGNYRGSNWSTQRKFALKRDSYQCRICGRKKQTGLRIDVHHIRPFKEFNGDYVSANTLTNLITLCRTCHSKVENGKIPIQPYLM